MLKSSYADPLRSYAKSKDTAILGLYESRTLFGNIDYLVPANEAFLNDLEQMISRHGPQTVGGIGDVALRHFKELQTFECYRGYYTRREEAQEIFKAEMSKKSGTGFAAFVEVRVFFWSERRLYLIGNLRGSNTQLTTLRTESDCVNCSWSRYSEFPATLFFSRT